MRVPMSSIGQVCRITKHAVGAPGNHVSGASGHGTGTARAYIVLQRLSARDRLYGPFAAVTGLRALPPREQTFEPITAIGIGSTAVRAGHASSLGGRLRSLGSAAQ